VKDTIGIKCQYVFLLRVGLEDPGPIGRMRFVVRRSDPDECYDKKGDQPREDFSFIVHEQSPSFANWKLKGPLSISA